MTSFPKSNKAQVWYSDFILGLAIFLLIFLLALKLTTENFILARSDIDEMAFVSKYISDSLMTEGIPVYWDADDVVKIGLTNGNNELNITKLDHFSNMTDTNFEATKSLLGTKYDFIIFFKDISNNTLDLASSYIGKPGVDEESVYLQNPDELLTVSRYLVLKKGEEENKTAEIIEMRLVIWK
ncbi:MAG: hypothetical protein KKF44_06285 [Nanoarchaeota archaeon]|nr:hypothetical protein [Nanoarchaeota archaeon]